MGNAMGLPGRYQLDPDVHSVVYGASLFRLHPAAPTCLGLTRAPCLLPPSPTPAPRSAVGREPPGAPGGLVLNSPDQERMISRTHAKFEFDRTARKWTVRSARSALWPCSVATASLCFDVHAKCRARVRPQEPPIYLIGSL